MLSISSCLKFCCLVKAFGKICEKRRICALFFPSHWLLSHIINFTLSQTSPGFYMSALQDFQKHCRKRRIACDEQFLLFPQCFLPNWRTSFHFHQIWNCRLRTLSAWTSPKFNPFPNNKFWILPNWKFADNNFKFDKMAESCPKG